MRITVIGRGHVGGGLARRWTAAGHDVTALGRAGGDAASADVVVVAIPGNAIADGLATVSGLGGQVTIDVCPSQVDRVPRLVSAAWSPFAIQMWVPLDRRREDGSIKVSPKNEAPVRLHGALSLHRQSGRLVLL